MPERKTRRTPASVKAFIDAQPSDQVREDCRALERIMRKATSCEAEMWGASIVGFGRHRWTGANGKQADWMMIAFSPRKAALTLYLWPQFEARQDLLDTLGTHRRGKGCLYIKRLTDVHLPTLERLIVESVKQIREPRAAVRSSRR